MPVFVWLIFTVFIVFIAAIVVRKLWLESYVKNLPKIPFKLLAPFCELRSHKSPVEIYQYAERVLNYRNGLTSLWIGLKLTVICDDPINMKTILLSKQCLNKPYFYRMLAEAGNGLFTATSTYNIVMIFVSFRSALTHSQFSFYLFCRSWLVLRSQRTKHGV